MQILELHGTSTKFGGASNGTKILFNEMRKQGINVFICTNIGNEVLLQDSNPNIFQLPLSSRNIFKVFNNLRYLYNLVRKNNIQLLHTHHRNDTIYGTIIKIFYSKIKIVYTVHGALISKKEHSLFYKIINRLFLALVNKEVDEIIYISHYTKQFTDFLFKGVKKQKVIHNGTPIPKVTTPPKKLLDKLGFNQPFIVEIIGGISGIKRPKIVLKIAEFLVHKQDIYFLFIGDGAEKDQLIKLMRKMKLNNTSFINTTPNIGNYLNISDIVISTAFGEGFGRTLIEAMAFKKPVIAFNIGGPTEIIKHNYNGFLIEDNNIKDFASKILLLYEDKKLAKEMGEKGYELYKKKFTEKIYVENHIKEFKKLI